MVKKFLLYGRFEIIVILIFICSIVNQNIVVSIIISLFIFLLLFIREYIARKKCLEIQENTERMDSTINEIIEDAKERIATKEKLAKKKL